MPKLPLFLAGLALGVVWLIYAQWTESATYTPDTLLASASSRIRAGVETPDYEAALHELEIALAMVEASGDAELIEEILETRAEALRDCGATAPAIRDYRRLLRDFRPGDATLELTLASLHQREGDGEKSREYVTSVLGRDPTHSNALVQLGKLYADDASHFIAQCDEVLYRSLPQDVDEHGRDLARRIASRDNLDPTRVALLQELGALFGPLSSRDAALAEDLLKSASQSYAQARESFTSAMEGKPNPQAYAGFLDILVAAGRFREASRFGLAALAHKPFQNDRQATGQLARALAQIGDLREAASVAKSALKNKTSLNETREWALLMYRAEDWTALRNLARTIEKRAPKGLAGEPMRREAAFYTGMVDYRSGRSKPGLKSLLRYIRMADELEEESTPLPGSVPQSPDLELDPIEVVELPFEGARAAVHLTVASMYRGQRNTANELKHLRRVTKLSDNPPGAVWKRIQALEDKRKIPAHVKVDTLTRVLSTQPDPNGQLMTKWHQLGRAALQADEKDPLDAGGRELRAQGQWYPEGEVHPYELYLLAQDHRRAGQPQGSFVCLRLLLEDYPGFRPAQDELIGQYIEAQRWEPLAPLLLDRVARWGATPRYLEVLRSLAPEVLTLAQRLERMRLDPLNSGVYAMVEYLASRGQTDRALEGLLGLGVDRLDSAGRVLAGEILTAQGNHSRAVETLIPISPSDPLYSRATSLRIEASLASGDSELLMSGVHELAEAGGLDSAEILRVSDTLAQGGHIAPALFLLERLDSDRETRHGSVFLRQSFHHMMAGELAEAEEDLERSEAYLETGAPLVGRVVLAAERGDWKSIPPELALLRNARWTPRPLQSVAVLALEDRLEEARALLNANLEKGHAPHHWLVAAAALSTLQGMSPPALPFGTTEDRREALSFVTGSAGHSRDARETFVLLLALEDPTWRPWVLRRLDTLESRESWASESDGESAAASPERSVLYPYLQALTLDHMDDLPEAIAACEQAIALRPDFESGWDLMERLVGRTTSRADDPALLMLRQRRRTAMGRAEENLAEGLLLEAQELAEAGEIDAAISKAQWALREDRRLVHARILLSQLEVRAGKYRAAQGDFDRLFRDLPPEEAAELVPEYVRALERFMERGLVQPTEAARDLAGLAKSLPRDPDVALALARMELRAAGANIHAGVSRVWRRLEELRERLDGLSIEAAAPSAMRRWYDFAVSLDPRRADQLVRAELELEPHSPDLWLMHGEALEAQYRHDEALAQYRSLLELFPEKPVLRRVTALMAQQSESPADIEGLLYDSIDLHDWRLDDVSVRAMLARAYASGGSAYLDTAIGLYEELWRERARFPTDEPRVEDIGQEYGEALLQRGLRSDRKRARQVFAEIEPLIVDGPRRDLCRALGHMARYLPLGRAGAGRGESANPADEPEEAASPAEDQRSAAAR